jgi:hypothetical protein
VLAFLDLFDNREKAVVFWLALIVLFAIALRDVRRLLPALVRTAIAPQLALPFVVMAAYMTASFCSSRTSVYGGSQSST